MTWLWIAVSVIVLWIALIWKLNYTSWSASDSVFLRNGGASHKRNVLLVIAHPDDESMFFSPTINYLTSIGHNLHILCLSTGNADGKGRVRKEELYQACVILKVRPQQVKILDHPELQDGFGKVWDSYLLAKIIEEEMNSHDIDSIITFDNYGISGHCNHRDVHQGVRSIEFASKFPDEITDTKQLQRFLGSLNYISDYYENIAADTAILYSRQLLHNTSQRNIEAWELVSTNILRKYSGPGDIWFSMSSAKHYASQDAHCLVNKHPRKSFLAMAQHMSQWVWFRKLFVSFSSYTYVNTLRKMSK